MAKTVDVDSIDNPILDSKLEEVRTKFLDLFTDNGIHFAQKRAHAKGRFYTDKVMETRKYQSNRAEVLHQFPFLKSADEMKAFFRKIQNGDASELEVAQYVEIMQFKPPKYKGKSYTSAKDVAKSVILGPF